MIWLLIFIIIVLFINGYHFLQLCNHVFNYSKKLEFHDTSTKLWCKKLRNNIQDITKEYLDYTSKYSLKRFRDLDSNQTLTDTSEIPWEILILRIYNKDTTKIEKFPITYKLISEIPGCSLAMFSILKPGKKLAPHVGPYSGVLRYHLSLLIPKNKNDCFLIVNDIKKSWEDGQDLLFDDTFVHSVENNTNETRVVLFLDIRKEFNNIFLDWFNKSILYIAKFNTTVDTIVQNVNKN